MDEQPFLDVVDCRPCKFVVGPNKKSIWIHPFLIAHHSKPLNDLIENERQDKHSKVVPLFNTSDGTFARFFEYLYTGNYTAASHTIAVEVDIKSVASDCGSDTPQASSCCAETEPEHIEELPVIQEQTESVEIERRSFPTKKKKKFGTHKESFWAEPVVDDLLSPPPMSPKKPPPPTKEELCEAFKSRSYADQWTPKEMPSIRANQDPCEVYKDVFLSHADMYAFATRYEVDNLRILALDNLHKTLAQFILYDERASDVSSLLAFAYEAEIDDDSAAQVLRSMVIDYAVCHFEKLLKDELFQGLLGGPTSFAVDLMTKLTGRLH